MKKKALVATESEVFLNGLIELFNFEVDFDGISRFNIFEDYNYNSIDLIIIDEDLELVEKIREKGYKKSIISIFANDEAKVYQALENGASDALLKPLSYDALMIRARASIYLEEHTFEGAMTINNFIFMPKARSLRFVDKEIKLTEKEAGLINLLYQSKPSSVDRLSLLKEVWGYNSGISTHTLETHIYRLRQKIENITDEKLIITLEDGYTLA